MFRQENGGISAASNSALELARGEIVALLDHDDVLRPHALLLVAQRFAEAPDLGFVYSDEDKIDDAGARTATTSSPTGTPSSCVRRTTSATCRRSAPISLVRSAAFAPSSTARQDWDLALRLTARLDDDRSGTSRTCSTTGGRRRPRQHPATTPSRTPSPRAGRVRIISGARSLRTVVVRRRAPERSL